MAAAFVRQAFGEVQRAFRGVDDVPHGDLLGFLSQQVTTLGSAYGGHQPRPAQVPQQLFQIVLRNADGAYRLEGLRTITGVLRQVVHGVQPVLSLGG